MKIQRLKNVRRLSFVYYLIIIMCGLSWPSVLPAQTGNGETNGVMVSAPVVTPGSPTTVTFNVSLEKDNMPTVWSDSVWVFVDYNDNGEMKRLLLSGATLTNPSWSGAEVILEVGNNKGAWVVSNTKIAGSFSATVQLFTDAANLSGVCVYASNYPPVGEYVDNGNFIHFTGTPPYNLVLKEINGSGTLSYPLSSSSYYVATVPDYAVSSTFTDKTGAPGKLKCMPMEGSIDFTVSPESVPKGQPATFTVSHTPTKPVIGLVTYTWSATGFDPVTHTGATFSTTAPEIPGGYSVKLTAHSEGYCDLSRGKEVPVIACIVPGTFTLMASAPGFCAGDEDGVTFELLGTQTSVRYQLFRGADAVGTPVEGTGYSVTFTGSFIQPGVYKAESIADGTYCAVAMDGMHDITSYHKPTKPNIAVSPSANVCQNSGDIEFRAAVGDGGTLTWLSTGGGTPSGSTVTFASSVTGIKTVSAQASELHVTSGDPLTCYSDITSATATVHPLPTVLTAADNARCGTGTVQLTAVPSDGAVIDWYSVATGGVASLSGNNTYTTQSISASTTYYAQARNTATGCVSASRTPVVATINLLPEVPTGASANSRCGSGTVTFSASVPGGVTIDWYNTLSGGSTVAVGMTTYSPSINNTTTYYAQARNTTTGCVSDTRLSVIGTVNPVPSVNITPLTTTTTPGAAATLTANVSNCSGCAYNWSGGGTSSTKQVIVPATGTSAYYTCTVTNSAGCSATSAPATVTGQSGPSGTVTTTNCTACCYNGSSWVDCYVTTYSYPFSSTSNNTTASWIGGNTTYFSSARSDKNGKENTAAIIAGGGTSTSGAVGICNSLGSGWYLPAYEELYAMSSGAANASSNNRAGAEILTTGYHWSSTEYYNNGGRYSYSATSYQARAVIVYYDGSLTNYNKTGSRYVRCAWRP